MHTFVHQYKVPHNVVPLYHSGGNFGISTLQVGQALNVYFYFFWSSFHRRAKHVKWFSGCGIQVVSLRIGSMSVAAGF
jgi:hypothetical protein